jgi:hypothetical protein
VNVDRDSFRQKQTNPFQEKLSTQYLEGSPVCKAEKVIPQWSKAPEKRGIVI